jgi:hypothetical protein
VWRRIEQNLKIFRWEASIQRSLRHVHGTTERADAVLKMNAQAGQNGIMNKTSLESTAQDEDLQAVKRRKKHISNDTSETAKKTPNQSQYPQLSSSFQKQCQLATSSHPSELMTWTLRLLEQRTIYQTRRLPENQVYSSKL